MARQQDGKFEFDGAISFAGENREIARSLAGKLKAKGFSIFYDEDRLADLWGKDRREFERIYGPASRYVIPIISEHYVRKDWTQFEFGSAKREQRNRPGEFILPVRVDDSRMVGLHDDEFYVSLDNRTLDQIADLFEAKIRAGGGGVGSVRCGPASKSRRSVAILSTDAKRALGLIVISSLPLPKGLFEALYPSLDWPRLWRELSRHRLLRENDGLVRVTTQAAKAIRSDPVEARTCTEQWVARLEELKDHQDIAIYLAIHYTAADRWDDAALLLADVACPGLHGHWNETYLNLLGRFAGSRVLRRLNQDSRARLFHAMGICSTEAGRPSDAIGWFEKSRKLSLKAKDTHRVGLCLIDSGVAYNRSGNVTKAASVYLRAVRHGEVNDDPTLVGRALGNLAQLRLSEGDPDAAVAFMKRSIEYKKKGSDRYGLAVSSAQLGTIEAERGDVRGAVRHFTRAETMFCRLGMTYDRAKANYNLGNALKSLGEYGKAVTTLKRAFHLIDKADDYVDLRLIIVQALAQALQALERFAEIEDLFANLPKSPGASEHSGCMFAARLGVGVAQAAQGRAREGQANLKTALRLARKFGNARWISEVLTCLAGLASGDVFAPAPEQLTHFAKSEEKRRNPSAAADLWRSAAEAFARTGRVEEAEGAFSSVERCLKDSGAGDRQLLDLQFVLFAWRQRLGRRDAAIEALDRAERLAAEHEHVGDQCKALDQKGVCLQDLNLAAEALPLHQKAARLAEKHELATQLCISLNNLGEALRRLGRAGKAAAAFKRSEECARSAGDYGSALGAMANRALAVQDDGDVKAARSILARCSHEARKRECWREYFRVENALGGLEWRRGRLPEAAERYRAVLAMARRQKLVVEEAEIAVNYTRLLDKLGKSKQAMKLLRHYAPLFDAMSNACVSYEILAGLCYAAGDVEAARTNWEKGKAHALSVRNLDYAAICSSRLAEIHEHERKFDLAEEELEAALACEAEPEGRAVLLAQLLRVELAAGKEARAEDVFDEARGIAKKHGLIELLVDLHMLLGDHYWSGPLDSKRNALKAYAVALVESLTILDPYEMPAPLIHIIRRLTVPRYAPAEADFDLLLDDLRSELRGFAKRDERLLRFVLWPFESARRLLPLAENPRRFKKEVRKLTLAGIFP